MGDHFELLVDRLLTVSTLEAVLESKNRLQDVEIPASEDIITDFYSHRMDINDVDDVGTSPRKLVECRICHDGDEDSNMEMPCSCCGTLKYAHRGCVQRWCNEKGDTTCEICHQQFKPGYTAPPPLFHYGGIPLNFRGHWEISRRDFDNPQLIAMVATDGNFSDSDSDDYAAPASRSVICCRVVAIIFLVLLMLRHTLPILLDGAGEYKVTLYMLTVLRTAGILLPMCIMARAFTAFQRRRHQEPHSPRSSDDEIELPRHQYQPRVIHVP